MEKTDMIRRIAEYYGIEKNVDFARFFGISQQTAYARINKGIIDFEEIYERCPEISPEWLLSKGEVGSMLRSENGSINSNNTNIGYHATQQVNNETGKSVELALAALAKEQEALSRSQEQVSGLIELLRTKN